jgi:histone H1/5
MRTVLGKTKNYGTPAEKRAVDKGLKAAAKAQKEGKSKKEADAIGKKITTNQMKTDRGKTNVEALWTAATILPLGIGQAGRIARTGYKTGQAVKKLSEDRIKKEVAKKTADAARKKAADAAKKLKETQGYLAQSKKAKKAAKLADATAAKKKAADAARRKAAAEASKQQKLVTAANKKGRRKYTNFVERGANSAQGLRVVTPAAVTASRATSEKKPDAVKKPKPTPVKKPKPTPVKKVGTPTGKMSASVARKLDSQTSDEVGAKRMKPVKKPDLSFREDEGAPRGTVSKKSTTTYTPRKKYEGGIDTYDTPFGKIKADSSDDAFDFSVQEKDGGYLKKDIMAKKMKKGGKVSSGYKCSHNRLY